MIFFVQCPFCNENHDIAKVKFLNIEEDIQGRDLVTFECLDFPDQPVQSIVFSRS
jgi:hypothetical protein